MRLKEKLKILEKKLREMYIDGAKELAQKTESSSGRFLNLYSELLHVHKEMKDMANGDLNKDCDKFDEMILFCLKEWGKLYNKLANDKISKYVDVNEIPENIFRSASPGLAHKTIRFGNKDVKVVSFKHEDLNGEPVYTVDEINWIKSRNIDNKAIDNITAIKETFPGSYFETDFDELIKATQSKGAKEYEGGRLCKADNRFPETEFSRELRLPLEEQQRNT